MRIVVLISDALQRLLWANLDLCDIWFAWSYWMCEGVPLDCNEVMHVCTHVRRLDAQWPPGWGTYLATGRSCIQVLALVNHSYNTPRCKTARPSFRLGMDKTVGYILVHWGITWTFGSQRSAVGCVGAHVCQSDLAACLVIAWKFLWQCLETRSQ